MKKLILLTFLCTSFIGTFSFAQQSGNLTLSDASPKQGEVISLTYKTALANTDDLKGYLLYLTPKLNYYTLDVPLTADNGVYKSKVSIPDSAVVIGFVFKNKGEQDANAEKGYTYVLKGKNGKDAEGAYRAMSLLYSGLGNYFIGMKADKSQALASLDTELKNYPESKNEVLPSYYSMLMANKKTDDAAEVKEELLKSFSAAKDEDAETKIYSVLSRTDQSTADSLKNIIITHPNGTLASGDVLSKFAKEQDLAKMEAEYAKLMTNKNSKVNKEMLTYYMAKAYSSKKDYDKMLVTLDKMKSKGNAGSLLNAAAWPMSEAGEQLELAEKLSKKSLDYVEDLKSDGDYLKNYSPSQRTEAINSSYASYADTYAFILFKEGKLKDALSYQEKVVNMNNFSSAEMNERYIQFLIANSDNKKAVDQLKTLIADGKSTSVMKDQLKEVYLKDHSETEYATLLTSLEQKAKENARQELMAKMINMKSPDFSLRNLKGETVSLASLKGKVVVVDFWATWCGPCKASFPGMQKALNNFKESKDVAFVFIDTWESIHDDKRIAAVSNFIEDNKYTFNVLLDTEDEKDKSKYDVVSAFGVDGIPTKFVLDKKGNIRFKAVGFSGNDDGLVDEVSAMIDMAGSPPATANIEN